MNRPDPCDFELETLEEDALALFGEAWEGAGDEDPLSDRDLEMLAAFAERRLLPAEKRALKKRLDGTPALRRALSSLIICARGTEYEAVLRGEAEERAQPTTELPRLPGFWDFRWCFARWIAWTASASAVVFLMMLLAPLAMRFFEKEVSCRVLAGVIQLQGKRLETPGKGTGLFALADHTRVAMAGSSALRLRSETEIAMERGAVWLEVNPSGKGFQVQTDFGMVQVTGTSFGVSVPDHRAEVHVTRGVVEVSRDGVVKRVSAGNMLVLDQAGLSDPRPREGALERPLWAQKAENPGYLAIQDLKPALWLAGNPSDFELRSGQVARWSDRSGNSRHALPAERNATLPTYQTANTPAGSFGVLSLDGVNQALEVDWIPTRGDYTAFVVAAVSKSNGAFLAQDPPGSNSLDVDFGLGDQNGVKAGAGQLILETHGIKYEEMNSAITKRDDLCDGNFHVFAFRVTGTHYEVFCDGAGDAITSTQPGVFGADGKTKLAIGPRCPQPWTADLSFIGAQIAEIVILPRPLTDPEFNAVNQGLTAKYGLDK